MKKTYFLSILLLLSTVVLDACVRANPHCKKAHKNIKKLHLNNW